MVTPRFARPRTYHVCRADAYATLPLLKVSQGLGHQLLRVAANPAFSALAWLAELSLPHSRTRSPPQTSIFTRC
jgi:hypothetical protein